MNNIVVLSLDNDYAKRFAKVLAEKLEYPYVDLSKLFDEDLISSVNLPFVLIDEILNKKESYIISEFGTKENVVLYVDHESFLSNKNYENLKNSQKILIEDENNDKIMKNIQNLLEKHCNFIIKKENQEKMIEKLKEKL